MKPLAFAAALLLPFSAQADNYSIDPRHTLPSFEISHLGLSTQRGYFEKSRGRVSLDLAAHSGSVELEIEVDSLRLGDADWSRHMVFDEGFFDVVKFPTMRFKSDKLIFAGEQLVGAEGQFTLRDVTRPLRLEIAHFRCAPHPLTRQTLCGADVTATLKRSEFGMGKFSSMIGDEVKITAPVEARKE